MRLVLQKHKVAALVVGNANAWSNHVLTVAPEAVSALFPKRDGLRLVEIRAAAPLSSMRFGPVLDVVGIRYCHGGPTFPGVTGPASDEPERKLTVLENSAVCVVSNLAGVQEGVIDTDARWSPLSSLHFLICTVDVSPTLDRAGADAEIRLFQCCLAELLASLASEDKADEEEILEWQPDPKGAEQLPKVGAVYFIQAQGALRRTFYRGIAADDMTPRLIDPLECLGGALTSGNYVMPSNKTCTYIHHQAPVLRELLVRHKTDWCFSGVILANEASSRQDKEDNVKGILELAKGLKLQGVIINQEGGGNADLDIMLACSTLESAGIATVLLVNEFAGPDGKTPSLTEYTPAALYMVSTGNNDYPAPLASVRDFVGFSGGMLQQDVLKNAVVLPLTRHYGSTNQLGFGRLSCEGR
ncbi:MAG: glycine/sarcosine/betaine reductase component B subunit [Desulfovibrionaceae bacterium]|nr:glycine/sarcosine/betaine reductase component B subunit [Desulfovibrionaceae bacterium]